MVLIALRNMLGPSVNELLQRALHLNAATQLFVSVPKPDSSMPNPRDATLSNGRPPYVAACVLEEIPYLDRDETRASVRQAFRKAEQCRTAELGAEV